MSVRRKRSDGGDGGRRLVKSMAAVLELTSRSTRIFATKGSNLFAIGLLEEQRSLSGVSQLPLEGVSRDSYATASAHSLETM